MTHSMEFHFMFLLLVYCIWPLLLGLETSTTLVTVSVDYQYVNIVRVDTPLISDMTMMMAPLHW